MHNFASHQAVNATHSPDGVRGKGPSTHGESAPQSAAAVELIHVVYPLTD